MMTLPDLEQEQKLLLQALLGPRQLGHDTVMADLHAVLEGTVGMRRGLQVYQANASALAERALAAAYPVVDALIGRENFAFLAWHFWREYPPVCGDMARWGQALPDFLRTVQQLAEQTFLADVACVEWALHQAATARDAVADIPSFQWLLQPCAQPVGLVLSPGLFVFASAYPVVSILGAHVWQEPSLAVVAQRIKDGVGEHALVWRQGLKPMFRMINVTEYALIAALQAKKSLEDALHAVDDFGGDSLAFDFQAWLGQAVNTGVVIGAYLQD